MSLIIFWFFLSQVYKKKIIILTYVSGENEEKKKENETETEKIQLLADLPGVAWGYA